MDIVVCIKQVPDTTNITIDPKTGAMEREGVPSIINPEDKHAIEAGISMKGDGTVILVSMGPPQAEIALREGLAMGADEAILLTDRAFAGSDTLATSYVLSKAIEKIGKFDLVICGRQAIDGDTAQIGPQIAELLNIPQITYVQKVEVDGLNLLAERELEDGYEVVKAKLPALITVIKNLNNVRYPNLKGVIDAYSKNITVWSSADIDADPERTGFKGSPTWVRKVFAPQGKGQGKMIEGSLKEQAEKLIEILKEKELIQEF